MGPFMVEIVFCRVTRRGRKLKKGMNKAGLANMRNDGPSQSFIPADDTIKITLDLSENGPVFNALDEMMMKMLEDESSDKKTKKKGGKAGPGGAEAKKALKSLLKSGIPGIEKMFAPAGKGKKGSAKGFHKMNEGSKKKFMKAIFGEDGTAIETGTAAALIAATCSGGDPEVGDKIAQLLVPELGEKIDPTMMAALMISCSMISAGAGMEEVLKAMKAELLDSGMPEEEIFRKTQLLMQAFGRDESGSLAEYSLVGKQKNSALRKINISPKDFAQIALLQRTLGACGATPENLAKVIMIQNQLSKRGAQSRHIADALRKLTDPNKGKNDTIAALTKAIGEPKMKKEDVQVTVRMMQALEMENDAAWKEVKNMKEMLQGASPTSPEAIELNLARATKGAGLNRGELTRVLVAQRTMSVLGIDPTILSQVMNIEKVIADNGVPAVEIARVLSDGGVPTDARNKLVEMTMQGIVKDYGGPDVDAFLHLYDGLKLKSNVPEETIEHIDKTLIQVRCSLEDVADNLVSSMSARGEKDNVIVRNLCETLKDTGATVQIIGTTMMGTLTKALLPKTEPEIMKDTGRSLTEVGYNTEDVNSTMTEILLNVLDEKPEMREEAVKACEVVMKDSGQFPDEIRTYLDAVVPEPKPLEDTQLAQELERLRAEDEARGGMGDSDGEPEYDENGRIIPKIVEPRNMAKGIMDRNGSGPSSRRGSYVGTSPRGSISIGGSERRGSFYSDDVSKRDSVAICVDDPENQKNMEKALNEVFDDESKSGGSLGAKALAEEKEKLASLSGKEREAQLALVEALESSLASDDTEANPLLAIQENLIKAEMEKLSQLSGPEKEAQLSKIESLKKGLSPSSISQQDSTNAKGPSWKERLSSLSSVEPSDLSIESSLDLIDKEYEKVCNLSGPQKARALNELQELKQGLLTDLIQTADSDQRTDTILRLLENKEDIPLLEEVMGPSETKNATSIKFSQKLSAVDIINQSQVRNNTLRSNQTRDPQGKHLQGDHPQFSTKGLDEQVGDPLASLALNLARGSGDMNNLSPSQASQILSLVNEAVSSDVHTSNTNLLDLKKLLSNQSQSGDPTSAGQKELSKILGDVLGTKIEGSSSTTTGPIGSSPEKAHKQKKLLADILNLTATTNTQGTAAGTSQLADKEMNYQAGEAALALISKHISSSGGGFQEAEIAKLISQTGSSSGDVLAAQIGAMVSSRGGVSSLEQGNEFIRDGATSLNQRDRASQNDIKMGRGSNISSNRTDQLIGQSGKHHLGGEVLSYNELEEYETALLMEEGRQTRDDFELKEHISSFPNESSSKAVLSNLSDKRSVTKRDSGGILASSYENNERSRRAYLFQDNKDPTRNASSYLSIDEGTSQNDAHKRENIRQYIRDSDNIINEPQRDSYDSVRGAQRDSDHLVRRAQRDSDDYVRGAQRNFEKLRKPQAQLEEVVGHAKDPSYSRSLRSEDLKMQNETRPQGAGSSYEMRSNYRIGGQTKDDNRQREHFRQGEETSMPNASSLYKADSRSIYSKDSDRFSNKTVDPEDFQSAHYSDRGTRSRFSESSSYVGGKAVPEARENADRFGDRESYAGHGSLDRYSRRSQPLMDSNSILFNSVMRRIKRKGNGTGTDAGLDDEDALDLDPEAVNEMVSAIQQSGLSEAEIKKLMGVFKLDGKITHIGGVSKFRTSDNIKNLIMDTEDMFDKALDNAEAQRRAIQNIGVSPETRKLMQKILATQKSSENMSERVSSLLASTGLTSTKGVDYRKRDDVDRIEYSAIKDSTVRRSKRRFDMPDIEPEETYRHPASLGIGVIGTGNQRLVRRNVQRVSRFKALEESRESSVVDDDRRITGLRRAKVPLMVYSCGGFTRCYRIARFYSVDGPPIGLKYRDNPTSGL